MLYPAIKIVKDTNEINIVLYRGFIFLSLPYNLRVNTTQYQIKSNSSISKPQVQKFGRPLVALHSLYRLALRADRKAWV